MPERMWSLKDFQFDESIEADEVEVFDLDGDSALLSREAAITLAHQRGANLIAWWPPQPGEVASCVLGKVSQPVRWEFVPNDEPQWTVDERLWFESDVCGQRDFLVGNGHTFTGRMAAWCPHQRVGYNVSLSELDVMSDETRYYIAGFLAGNEPDYPFDEESDVSADDITAWESAVRRFRRTGLWYGRWSTCQVCGCVLLPDSASGRCHEHLTSPAK